MFLFHFLFSLFVSSAFALKEPSNVVHRFHFKASNISTRVNMCGAGTNAFKFSCSSLTNGAYPDPCDCTKGYYCNNGLLAHPYQCKSNQYFWTENINGTYCQSDTEGRFGCCTDSSLKKPECTSTNLIGGFGSASCDVRYYYVCIPSGTANVYDLQIRVCGRGLIFDDNAKTCVAAGFDTPPTPPTCTGIGALPNREDCTTFWYCDRNNEAFLEQCQEGTYYDCSHPLGCSCQIGTCT